MAPGDLVRIAGSDYELLIIGTADDDFFDAPLIPSWFCVWEYEHRLFEEVFSEDNLTLVRKERRRIPRGGELEFPCHVGAYLSGNSGSG